MKLETDCVDSDQCDHNWSLTQFAWATNAFCSARRQRFPGQRDISGKLSGEAGRSGGAVFGCKEDLTSLCHLTISPHRAGRENEWSMRLRDVKGLGRQVTQVTLCVAVISNMVLYIQEPRRYSHSQDEGTLCKTRGSEAQCKIMSFGKSLLNHFSSLMPWCPQLESGIDHHYLTADR